MTQWNQLGPRERELLAILRRSDGGLTTRDLLERIQERGDSVAYTTVNSTAERLVEKDLLTREVEQVSGSRRHRYEFDAATARETVLPELVSDVATVFGEPGVATLARAARENEYSQTTDPVATSDTETDDY